MNEMLTGDLPVGRFKLPSHINPDIPREVDEVIENSLATLPDDRPSDIKSIASGLKAGIALCQSLKGNGNL